MKLACITVTYNDIHLLEFWKEYYNIYQPEIDLHIIVDNKSNKEYKSLLYNAFPDSVIIELDENGGVTKGFNAGIKRAMLDPQVGFIALICPDIKFSPGSLTLMKKTLEARNDVGIIGPALYGRQNNIEGFGARLTKYLAPRFIIPDDLNSFPEEVYVDFISGGINMIKRKVYETIGYQEEMLFMYGDEVDFDIRAKKAGFELVVLKKAISFHMHIFQNNDSVRSRLAYFLFSRNTFILYRKHLHGITKFKGYFRFTYYSIITILELIRIGKKDRILAYLHGVFKGLIGKKVVPQKYLK